MDVAKLERDALFKKLRAKPENKVGPHGVGSAPRGAAFCQGTRESGCSTCAGNLSCVALVVGSPAGLCQHLPWEGEHARGPAGSYVLKSK